MFAIKIRRKVLAFFLAIIAAVSGVLISAQPASAATCKTHSKSYTLSGGFKGTISFTVCHNEAYVTTFKTKFTNDGVRAVIGSLHAADNHNNAYDTARSTYQPGFTLSRTWDHNRNWYNGYRACGVFIYGGVTPSPAGHACIKMSGGNFVND